MASKSETSDQKEVAEKLLPAVAMVCGDSDVG